LKKLLITGSAGFIGWKPSKKLHRKVLKVVEKIVKISNQIFEKSKYM